MLEHRSFIVPELISKEEQRSLNYQIVLFLAGWVTFHVVASNPVMCAAVLTAVNFATKVLLKVLTWSRSRLKAWLLVEVGYPTLATLLSLSCAYRRVSSTGLAIYWTESSHEIPYQIFFRIFFGHDVADCCGFRIDAKAGGIRWICWRQCHHQQG